MTSCGISPLLPEIQIPVRQCFHAYIVFLKFATNEMQNFEPHPHNHVSTQIQTCCLSLTIKSMQASSVNGFYASVLFSEAALIDTIICSNSANLSLKLPVPCQHGAVSVALLGHVGLFSFLWSLCKFFRFQLEHNGLVSLNKQQHASSNDICIMHA